MYFSKYIHSTKFDTAQEVQVHTANLIKITLIILLHSQGLSLHDKYEFNIVFYVTKSIEEF